MSWAITRRDDIVAEILANENERNDEISDTIKFTVSSIVANVVSELLLSYLETRNITAVSAAAQDKILQLAGDFRNEQEFSLVDGIFQILINEGVEPHIGEMGNRITKYLKHEDSANHAVSLAITETALNDAMSNVYG